MEKLIDEILDIFIDNVSCRHEVDWDEDGKHDHAEYNIDELLVKQKIKAIIKEPDEKLIEKKAKELHDELWSKWICPDYDCSNMIAFKTYFRSLLKEYMESICGL